MTDHVLSEDLLVDGSGSAPPPPEETSEGRCQSLLCSHIWLTILLSSPHTAIKATLLRSNPPSLFMFLFQDLAAGWDPLLPDGNKHTHIYISIFRYSPHNLFCYVCAIRMCVCGDLRTNHKRVCNKWNAAGWNLPTSQLQIRHQRVNRESRGRVCASVRAAFIAPLYILSGDLFFFLLTFTAKVVTPHISKLPSEDKQ